MQQLRDRLAAQKLEVLRLLISVLHKATTSAHGKEEDVREAVEKCGNLIFQSNDVNPDRTIINKADILAAEQCLTMLLEERRPEETNAPLFESKLARGDKRPGVSGTESTAAASRRAETQPQQPSRLRRRKSLDNSPKLSYSAMHMRKLMLQKGRSKGTRQTPRGRDPQSSRGLGMAPTRTLPESGRRTWSLPLEDHRVGNLLTFLKQISEKSDATF